MKKLVSLSFINDLEERIGSNSYLIQVLLGPRQVGKTTTVLSFLESKYVGRFHYVNADRVTGLTDHSWLRENWQVAREKNQILVIDEIQKIENWAETVKSLWDEDRRRKSPVRSVLLGSSSLELQRGLSESLTGRFQLLQAHHWNFQESEAGYEVSFEQFLRFGGYPGSYDFISTPQDWSDYVRRSIVQTVIEKDILLNHTVKSPALFKQAFELVTAYPAQEISYTKLLGQLQDKGNTDLVKHYLKLLEGAYLIRTLEKFSTKVMKTRTSSPKILPLCPAFYYLHLMEDYSAEERGHVFELIVGAQLNRTGLPLFYWREGAHEVDYVLKNGKKIWAIEVKSGRRRGQKGIENFKKQFPQAHAVFITTENYVQFEKDPVSFLEQLTK